jgi:hypothetical protein
LPDLSIFYEQKANLPRERLVALKNAGIDTIQPGIEALSSDLLRQMRKGVSARQNLALLRDARGLNISLVWNLLWGFPGDRLDSYRETLALLPLLHHLQPPSGFWPVLIDRFSPYFYDAKNFGISNIRPLPGYFDINPAGTAVDHIAYHFNGDFECASAAAPSSCVNFRARSPRGGNGGRQHLLRSYESANITACSSSSTRAAWAMPIRSNCSILSKQINW